MALVTRRHAAIGGITLAMLAGAAFAATALLSIAPLLPAQSGSVCYAAAFDGSSELRFGWGRKVDEGPAPVMAMRVRIEPPPPIEPPAPDSPFYGQPVHGYGFIYQATIVADIKGRGRLSAPTQCNWAVDGLSAIVPDLYCGIDCDGGGVTLSRVPGRRGLRVTWDADRHLRMSSCGGGGAYVRAEGAARSFRLEPAPASACEKTAGRD